MTANTKIEWADHTFNPWIGCTRVSPGCDNCYAAVSTPARTKAIAWGAGQPRQRTTSTWSDPKHWNERHAAFFAEHGRRQRVFCASLADWLDKEVPIEWLVDLLKLVRTTRDLDWMLLTKRIGNWRARIEAALRHLAQRGDPDTAPLMGWLHAWLTGEHVPRNVWIGATIVNQEEADRDIPKLLETPARVRFLSMEPLLGPVDLNNLRFGGFSTKAKAGWDNDEHGLHWVIVGGESGPGARPMHPDWARSLSAQCAAASVPFHFKQWGEWAPVPELSRILSTPRIRVHKDGGSSEYTAFDPACGDYCMHRAGKKASGRLLDGVTHDGFPEVR